MRLISRNHATIIELELLPKQGITMYEDSLLQWIVGELQALHVA